MCINDLYCCGAQPLAFIDYLGHYAGKYSLSTKEKKEMHKVFNMGIGLVAIMSPSKKELPSNSVIIGIIQ